MMYLALSQANTVRHLSLIAVDDDGWLYDPTSVEFLIQDLSTGTATQVFPAGPDGTYKDVTTSGKHDTGVWFAYDTTDGWAPSGNEGLHVIKWRYRAPDGTSYRSWEQRFQVSAAGLGLPYGTYISPNEVRAEGLSVAACADSRLIDLIERAQEYIERACRQPFRPVLQTLKADGDEAHTLHLPLPIVGIDYVKLNNSTSKVDHSSLAIYATPAADLGYFHQLEDYRRNPRIALKADLDIYSGAYLGAADVFAIGRRNQQIKGVFGYLERDGTAPRQITYAALKLVYATASKLTISSSSSSSPAGPIKKEKVDRHEIEYMESSTSSSTTALSTSPEVEEIIQLYKSPIAIGAAGPRMTSRVRVY